MGCCYSRLEREEMVSRCKARKRYMKQLVKARQAMSASHAMYLRSLRATGSSLLHFSNSETTLHHPHHFHTNNYHHRHSQTDVLPPPPPPPLSPISSSAVTWTTTTTSSTTLPPPPPPPPPPQSSSWDFWDPFVPPPPPSEDEGEWGEEVATTTMVSDTAVTATEPSASVVSSGGSTELAMVVRNSNGKDLGEILKEVDEYFLRAADAGGQLSCLLEVNSNFNSKSFSGQTQIKGGKVYNEGCNLTSPSLWSWGSSSPKLKGFGKLGDLHQEVGGTGISHCSTVERLYAWEKKLFQEVKNAVSSKIEHDKKVTFLRKLELKGADYMKTEKTKKEVEKLESEMMVATQAIDSTSCEIIKLRETELYPQLLELLKGLMCMWRSMYEAHQVQTHIVQQLKFLNTVPSTEPTSEIHRQSTLQLELQVQQWHLSFCNLVKAHQDYIQSLTGWLRLSLFQFSKNPLSRTSEESRIYSLCEEWHHAVDRIPDKVASEGIKSFLTVIHAIVVQQAEEHKQKKKSESAFKELKKKVAKLRSLESKFGPYTTLETPGSTRDPVMEKQAKVEIVRAKAEEEKTNHEKSVSITRAMTINNLQMGFPHVFQSMVGFSSVCMQAFESVYNQAKSTDEHDAKRLLP